MRNYLMLLLTRILLLTTLASAPFGPLYAQGCYEIQMYGSELVSPGATIFELHSNFTFKGSKTVVDGQYPTEHQLHETLEITHGFSDWFELGFYVFTSADSRVGWQWVGDHIRPGSPFRNRGSDRWDPITFVEKMDTVAQLLPPAMHRSFAGYPRRQTVEGI